MSDRSPSDRASRLRALHETTRELMEATTPEEVAEVGVEAASHVVDLESNAIHLYDESEGGLVPVAVSETTRELVEEIPTFTPGKAIAWRVYETGEPAVFEDVRAEPDVLNPATDIRSELHLPLGSHGILIAGSRAPNAFDEAELSIARVLAANVEVALDQVEREAALVRQKDRLEEFASVVSHDLRNPLTVARGYLELARETGDPAEFDRVEAAHDRMGRIVDNLLSLAREGEAVGATHPVDVREAVEAAWDVVREEGAGARLVVDDDLGTVVADYDRLCQLLENVLRNALDHAGPDVTVRVEPTGAGIAVEDDGPGVPAAARDRVFEQGHSTREGGTGLGLAIVREIAEAHGWSLRVTEGDGGGARFELAWGESDDAEP